MRTKEELLKTLPQGFLDRQPELETLVDIRDQLTRIADYLQPQIIGVNEEHIPGVRGNARGFSKN